MAASSSTSDSTPATRWWRGLTLVLLATLFLSLQNNLVKIAQAKNEIPVLGGLLKLGGYVKPDPNNFLQVPLLVLLVRITFLVPLLWIILPLLKPGALSEAKQVIVGTDRFLKWRVVLAGLFLFMSQTCTYLAVHDIGPAIAVTIFFIYPTVTTLLAWRFFGERPNWKQWVSIGLIYAGCTWLTFTPPAPKPSLSSAAVQTQLAPVSPTSLGLRSPQVNASSPAASPKANTDTTGFALGVIEAVIAGVVFAMEGIIAQSCFSKINPATFTGMVFTVEWVVLTIVALASIKVSLNGGLLLMGLLLCLATLSGYLFNNFGIKEIGAATTAIIGSSGPAVTAILGLLLLGDQLQTVQWIAILVVTLGVILMNLAKAQAKVSRS